MTVEEKAYNYASKLVKNRLTASEVATHYGRGYIEGQADMKQQGWHPGSELPPLNENDSSELVYALGKVFSKGFGEYIDKVPCRVRVIHGNWAPEDIEVKWWCYPPKGD